MNTLQSWLCPLDDLQLEIEEGAVTGPTLSIALGVVRRWSGATSVGVT